MRDKLLIHILFILVGLAIIHYLALSYKLYFTIGWLDLAVHFLASVCVALFVLWFFYLSHTRLVGLLPEKGWYVFFLALGSTIFIGVAWEIFEVWAGISFDPSRILDTAFDIVMDILGGLGAGWYFTHTKIPRVSSPGNQQHIERES